MDISKNYIPYFFLVGLIFFIHFLIITVFGYFILHLIKKYQIKEEEITKSTSFLEEIFISFGIGISIYISLGFLLDIFSLFNFITAYLFFVILDILIVIYLVFTNKKDLKMENLKSKYKQILKPWFSNKTNIIFLGVVGLTLSFILIIQWNISIEATSLNYSDPFKWYQSTFYLLDNSHTDWYNSDYNYPLGFAFFNGGILLIYPDYLLGYYFFKFMPLYFITLYIIIAGIIIRKLFNKKYLIILSFLFIATSRYLFSRMFLYISSSLATLLLIIAILIIINKYPDYLLGFFIASLYLTHALTAFYFIFVLSGFFVVKLSWLINYRERFLSQIYSVITLIIIVVALLVPYLIGIYVIYGDTYLDFLNYFFGRFEDTEYLYLFNNPENHHKKLIKLIFPLEFFKSIINTNLLNLLDELFRNSIYLFFIFPILGLFIYIKQNKGEINKEILLFFKLFIIVILIIYFISYVNPNLQFLIKFRKRILQSFNLPIVIMAVFTIQWIVHETKKLSTYLAIRFKSYNSLITRNKFCLRLFKIESLIIIFLMASLGSSVLTHRYPDYNYIYEDELVEVVLHLRDHAEPNSKILREDFDSTVVFRVLYDMKDKEWELNETSTYDDLLLEIDNRGIDYLIFSKDYFDNNTIEDSLCRNSDFKELVENDEYILFKIK
ncbi:MAG: hypothetical protein EU548_03430 [Promethearchaeota archaeon]|nr:MAG: hypothetical protein EU548_03430 [Candidatus Lokiarchaeota archaeon]